MSLPNIIDVKKAGIGLRSQHYDDVLLHKPDVGFLEIHIENYFAKGGKTAKALRDAASLYPMTFHGVSMSLGSATEPNKEHLKRVAELVKQFNPTIVSEHLSWSSIDDQYISDLLPVPYTEEALNIFYKNVNIVQDAIGRQILVENPSAYLMYDTPNAMNEGEFMAEIVDRTNCGILLDVNNIFVSSENLGTDGYAHMNNMPLEAVKQIHLAGHTIKNFEGDDYKCSDLRAKNLRQDPHSGRIIRIDTHSDVVCDEVWEMYKTLVQKIGPTPTLIEWDLDIPEFSVLLEEANKATEIMSRLKKGNSNAA